ncbi:MAG: hypothetical protein IT367_07980 [Candidatus Hydrogenedentes bacterium]|nr:hypothetical protein [Candidatus Hydrogenedentota bacterium]
MALASRFWTTMYGKWRSARKDRSPGYTILMMVPGDMAVFLDLALDVCGGQDLTHCAEILVIPDRPSPEFRKRFEAAQDERAHLPMRLVTLPFVDRLVTRKMNNPHHNYFLQLKNGIDHSRTTHVLLHDADLFIVEPNFLKAHYEACVERRLACLGLSPAWDQWYRDSGYPHVTATWELLIDVAWAQQYPPYKHHGHRDVLNGVSHEFDATLLPQCLTPPERVGRHDQEWGFVHFNYVISAYRLFQNSTGRYEDSNFRVLLVRLLIDACDRSGWQYDAPPISELAIGLRNPSRRVTYTKQETRKNYPEFRSKLKELIERGRLQDAQCASIRKGIEPFDRAFDWRG